MKKLKDVLPGLKIHKITGNIDEMFGDIQYDSRKCKRDSIFVAMRGNVTDGHKYIPRVIESGVKIIICEEIPDGDFTDITFIVVENARMALAHISHNFYGNPTKEMKVIGVTGTNGKTTITFLLKKIFGQASINAGIIGTTGIFYNDKKITATHTTPESLELAAYFNEMKEAGVEVVIMEVSSHALVQHRADKICFDAGIFTNLTHEHLDYHKTMQEYASAKKILFDMLPESTTAILTDNSDYSELLVSNCKSQNVYLTGRKAKADYRITNEKLDINRTLFTLDSKDKDIDFSLKLMGKFNIDNAAMSAVTAMSFGIGPEIIIEALENSDGAPGRMDRITLGNGAVGIVDYAHTPDALEKALLACREVIDESGKNSRLISVFGCGGDRDTAKRPLMGRISTNIADLSIITDDNPRTEAPKLILKDILSGIDASKENYIVKPGRREAIAFAVESSNKDDIILIAGKGHEDYQIIGTEKFHFDDKEELMKCSPKIQ